MKKLNSFLLVLLPAILFFSYFPVISLGETATMHLELSLPEIWLVLFFFTNLKNLKSTFQTLNPKILFLTAIFPGYATLSILWSANRLRTFLTAGILWLLFFAILNIIRELKTADSLLKQKILDSLSLSTTLVCLFCLLQCILDLVGLPRSETLLCAGCTYASFGFPHPNGFAVEPQFMGNLLLAPTLLVYYFLITKSQTSYSRSRLIAFALLFTTTLFLTFSRGAIYAFLISITAMLIISTIVMKKTITKNQKNHNRKQISKNLCLTFFIICATLVLSFTTQGIFSQLSPTSDTFSSGIAKSIHHLTLGKLDFRSLPDDEPDAASLPDSTMTANFSGYVAESTDRRVNLTNFALDIWDDSPANLIFGTGLGSAGVKMAEKYGFDSAKEIIQNQYASLLLELGLIGYATLAISAAALLKLFTSCKFKSTAPHKVISTSRSSHPTQVLKLKFTAPYPRTIFLASLLTAYAITLFFFSGLPNALHIYLLPPLLTLALL